MNALRGTLIVVVAALALGTGSAIAQQAVPNTSSGPAVESGRASAVAAKPKILIDASLRNDAPASVAWIAYGAELALHHPMLDRERSAGLHVYVPTFDADVMARKNQIVVWDQIKAKEPAISYAYMTQLEQINRAGFLREYVWEYYRQPGWSQPSNLKLARFDAWRGQHLPHLKAETHAHVSM